MSEQHTPPRPPPGTLPNEIIILIIDSLIPSNPKPLALRPSDPITKALLNLALTSKLMYSIAVPHLYSSCLYIDSFDRLRVVTNTLSTADHQYGLRSSQNRLRKLLRGSLLTHATSLYLAPWQREPAHSVDELRRFCRLLELLAPKLKRLVFHAPAHAYWSGGDFNDDKYAHIHPTLSKLTSLEICCSVNDELWMLTDEGEINIKSNLAFTKWPKLRVLSLAGAYPDEDIWKWWGSMPSLERLLLTDCYGTNERDWKALYMAGQQGRADVKKLETLIVDVNADKKTFLGRENWKGSDLLQIRLINVPTQSGPVADQYHHCQDWIVAQLLTGKDTLEG